MDPKGLENMSDKLTPLEIKNKDFKKTVWGYSPEEVVAFLDGVAKTWEKIQRHEKDLNERIKHLSDDLTRWKNKEIEISKLKEKAQQEAEEIKKQAQTEAEKLFAEVEERANDIRLKTEQWLEQVIAEVDETERQKRNFTTALRSALDSHYELLQGDENQGQPLAERLSHFLKMSNAAAVSLGN